MTSQRCHFVEGLSNKKAESYYWGSTGELTPGFQKVCFGLSFQGFDGHLKCFETHLAVFYPTGKQQNCPSPLKKNSWILSFIHNRNQFALDFKIANGTSWLLDCLNVSTVSFVCRSKSNGVRPNTIY